MKDQSLIAPSTGAAENIAIEQELIGESSILTMSESRQGTQLVSATNHRVSSHHRPVRYASVRELDGPGLFTAHPDQFVVVRIFNEGEKGRA